MGQRLARGFSVVFNGDTCSIFEKASSELMYKVKQTENNMILLSFPRSGEVNMAVKKMMKIWCGTSILAI